MAESEKKKLYDLRVVDLKSELEKRSLETSGVKTVLIERLEKALREEDENPEEYLFDISKGKAVKTLTPSKTAPKDEKPPVVIEKEEDIEAKQQPEKIENLEPVVETEPAKPVQESVENNNDGEDELILKDEEYEEIDGLGSESKADTDNDANIEDSLNLTIGEEEEQLLREDDDVKTKDIQSKEENSSVDKKAESGSKVKESIAKATSGKSDEASSAVAPSTTASTTSSASNVAVSTTTLTTTTVTEKKKITAPSPTPPETSSATGASNNQSRNLWVSGLASITRATDLKQIFSKHGKVVGAKIVTNTRSSNSRCFGYVTMASAKDATECITNLHKTTLHEKTITVERAKSDLNGQPSSTAAKSSDKTSSSASSSKISDNKSSSEKRGREIDNKKTASSSSNKDRDNRDSDRKDRKISTSTDDKTKDKKNSDEVKKDESETVIVAKPERKRISPPRSSQEKTRDRRRASPVKNRKSSPAASSRRRISPEILSFEKMREERERERRMREREKELRDEERRRREIKRRQYEEEQRLIREREKLELEKIKIAKEKAELVRIQRERQKLELEKIELERLELKRQQRKIEEEKRAIKRPLSTERYEDDRDRKRTTSDRRGFEPPPPPRFDLNRSYDRERGRSSDIKKRLDDYTKRDETSSYSSSKGRDDYNKPSRGDYKTSSSTSRGGTDDYKREVEISRHSGSSSYAPSSTRIDATASLKDRYSDRPSSSDYRSTTRSDDIRNGSSSKSSRFYESQPETRYDRPPAPVATNAWTPSIPHPQFSSGMNTGDIWAAKQQQQQQQQDTGNGWRGNNNMDDNRSSGDYRFSSNDRKPAQQFIDPSRSNQYMAGNSTLMQSATRFGNSTRW